MNNAQTMDIVFTWFLDERQMMPTLSNNIRVTDSRDRDGYKESVMLFVPPRIDAYHVRCMAGLGRLDNLTHEIRLITGGLSIKQIIRKTDESSWMSLFE